MTQDIAYQGSQGVDGNLGVVADVEDGVLGGQADNEFAALSLGQRRPGVE